jgi:hypothetical protein
MVSQSPQRLKLQNLCRSASLVLEDDKCSQSILIPSFWWKMCEWGLLTVQVQVLWAAIQLPPLPHPRLVPRPSFCNARVIANNFFFLLYFIDYQILQSLNQCAGLCTIYKLFIVHSSWRERANIHRCFPQFLKSYGQFLLSLIFSWGCSSGWRSGLE